MKDKDLLGYLKYINKTNAYNSRYGFDLIITIAILGGLLLGNFYIYLKNNKKYLKSNWKEHRCRPMIIPFAGYIHNDDVEDTFLFTNENFTYCLSGILSGLISVTFAPITLIVNNVLGILSHTASSIGPIKAFNLNLFQNLNNFLIKIYTMFNTIKLAIIKIILNLIEEIKNTIDEVNGLIGNITGIIQDIIDGIKLLGAVGITISVLVYFLGLALIFFPWWLGLIPGIPLIITGLTFLTISIYVTALDMYAPGTEVLESYYENEKCCFDKNTMIETKNGKKKISDIKIIDVLQNGRNITGLFKVKYNKNEIYKIDDIYVTAEHPIYYNNKWIRVDEHADSKLIKNYNEEYLYCINTSNKIIKIGNHMFQDWDELDNNDIKKLNKLTGIKNSLEINSQLEHGFHKDTLIELNNGEIKNIIDIKIGDVLKDKNKVYGVCILNGKGNKTINEYLVYDNTLYF